MTRRLTPTATGTDALIDRFMSELAQGPISRDLPDPATIWLKGRLARRWFTRQRALRPFVVWGYLAMAAGLLLTVLAFGAL